MLIESIPIADLHLDPANTNTHPDRNLAVIRASLIRFKQQRPILIDSHNVVRAGNGTLQAAIDLGWRVIDCVRSDLPNVDLTAYSITDNRSARLAETDNDLLAAQLQALQADGFPMEAVGYTDDEIAVLSGELIQGDLPADANGREYDESVADEVEFHECPQCGHKFPK